MITVTVGYDVGDEACAAEMSAILCDIMRQSLVDKWDAERYRDTKTTGLKIVQIPHAMCRDGILIV